ncbi:MAG TPA: tRNA (adenosine(37)-N6)-threonylcarbamoyltransferase complex ATPase subunit type 1 TsaE [Rhodanobacteraceae bacterium]|nr:tRNA (adenosine(37)-N6)-threonylcarbamoyltransferase complex ATPase subunit type 1 TsaE [Rhodanobacteraceae bacterium]
MSGAAWNAGTVDEAGLRAIAKRLATAAGDGGILYLEGDLGAGKTTFARALLTSLGVGERVKSPTYSLIESYRAGALDAHHLDLYRIADAGELEWLGLADLWTPRALVLVEWPERGAGALPPADLVMHFRHAGDRRGIVAEPRSAVGERLAAALGTGQNFTPSS